jgi:hypothetical protein
MTGVQADPVGARVTRRLRDAGWLPQSPEDGFGLGQPHFRYEVPLAGRTEDGLLKGMNRRENLRAVMEGCGFTAYACEWWHYTLAEEPFPDTYVDFPVSWKAPDGHGGAGGWG